MFLGVFECFFAFFLIFCGFFVFFDTDLREYFYPQISQIGTDFVLADGGSLRDFGLRGSEALSGFLGGLAVWWVGLFWDKE